LSGEKQGGVSSALFALVFAVCFGGVGAFATWVMGSTVLEGWAAREWVRVKADVVSYGGGNVAYKYRVGEREYTGDKLGPGPLSGGEVDDELDARISTAQAERKPITVFVDPEAPQKSVVDPEIPWQMVLFMTPFAFGFGGVGLGALVVAGKLLFGSGSAKPKTHVEAAGTGAGFLWIFAFFWNSIAFPIAFIAVPEMLRSGEWLGLLVLLFPLVGVLILWGAIATTWRLLKVGRAEFHLQNREPRLGGEVAGFVTGRRFQPGDGYRVRLVCVTEENNAPLLEHWSKERNLRVTQTPQGPRLSFGFDTPERLPAAAGARDESTQWQVRIFAEGDAQTPLFTFRFEMLPREGAAMVEVDDEVPVDLVEQPVPAGIPQGLEGIAAFVGHERLQEKIASLSTTERAQLHERFAQLPPSQREALANLGKYATYLPLVKKLAFWAIGLFIAIHVLGVVAAIVASS
jgi:hypothetical protein